MISSVTNPVWNFDWQNTYAFYHKTILESFVSKIEIKATLRVAQRIVIGIEKERFFDIHWIWKTTSCDRESE